TPRRGAPCRRAARVAGHRAPGPRSAIHAAAGPDLGGGSPGRPPRLDRDLLTAFAREMHARGVYVNPAWHHGLSAVHTDAQVDQICEAAEGSARSIVGSLAGAGTPSPGGRGRG